MSETPTCGPCNRCAVRSTVSFATASFSLVISNAQDGQE